MHPELHADAAAAREQLQGIMRRAEDLRPAWRDVVDVLEDAAERRFARQGEGDWPPLDPETLARRSGLSTRMLVETGRLRRSLTATGARDAIRSLRPGELVWGTRTPYAVHVARRRDPMPELDGDLVEEIGEVLAAYLMTG